MTISTRKARERMDREQLIIDHADELLAEHGYHGLNLDQLAERIEYSKATIYNHFESKEDLMAAVDLRHLKLRAELFSRALIFPGNSRERMCVVGWADSIIAQMYPHWSSLHQLMETHSIQEKVCQTRRDSLQKIGHRCFEVAYEIIRQARLSGDLPQDGPSDAHILCGLISLAKGAHLLESNQSSFLQKAGIRPLDMLSLNYDIFLDGAQWKPLHTDFNYQITDQRIQSDVFPEEIAHLQQITSNTSHLPPAQ